MTDNLLPGKKFLDAGLRCETLDLSWSQDREEINFGEMRDDLVRLSFQHDPPILRHQRLYYTLREWDLDAVSLEGRPDIRHDLALNKLVFGIVPNPEPQPVLDPGILKGLNHGLRCRVG